MNDQKNTILAIALSALVLIGWQYFIGMPQMEKQKQDAQLRQPQQTPATGTPGTAPTPGTPGAPAAIHRAAGAGPDFRAITGTAAHASGGNRRLAAHRHRDADRQRFGRAQGRPHRRPGAHKISRDRRSQITGDRAAGAVRQPAALLRGIRLGAGGGRDRETARPRHGLGTAGIGHARHQPPGDADL